MKRKQPTHSEDLINGASSSSTSPHVGDYEGGTKKLKGNECEVFLSFRGKDTRKGFTDHLYASLVNEGIHVFKDDNELRVGDEIDQELLCSITHSVISIPIISEDYASSKWCLRELAQMLKCKGSKGQLVLPIFYKVEPSQVRHRTGRFEDAINAHKKNLDQMVVKEWEDALKEVSFLKGWESENIDNGHEAGLVKKVVTRVRSELKRLFQLNVPEQLVGIDDRVEEIMSKIDFKFNGTLIIGIYGMGGIGKTTLAKVLYNKLFSHFENCSFIADIRRKGIGCLQKQLISDITRSLWEVSNVDDGINVLKSRFTSKKVIILLDDIDDNTRLDALIGNGSWFKVGSIVIITTRDKSVLDKATASHMYELNELPWNKSLILFSKHAFRKNYPPCDYKDVSYDVVSTTGGLPLALEIIGSFLCGKTEETWKDTAKKLRKMPHKKVQDTLMISYKALDYDKQQIFLDIACFSIGASKQYLTYMWDACEFFPREGLEVLSLMSLIKVDLSGELMMHDQLRDLGREIVRLENQKKPQKRSRLWIHEEAKDVLVSNKGTSKIEGLRIGSKNDWERYQCELSYGWKSYQGEQFNDWESYQGEQFNKLTDLRFLDVINVNLTGDFQNLLAKLRWLRWIGCPSDFKMANFHPKKLVVLDLSKSSISEDWGGWGPLKMATELKVLNLSSCPKLKRSPDLSAFKNLEILDFKDCTNLEEIHPSIGKLVSLTKLQLWDSRITKLPESIGNLQNLKNFSIRWWTHGITTLPESIGNLQNLTTLNIGQIPIGNLGTGITTLPESIGNLQNLRTLNIKNTPVTELPSSVGMLANLQVLDASRCRNLKGLPSSIGELVSLKELRLFDSGIRGLPESISKLSSLQLLEVRHCRNLREIPELPSSLTTLHITFPTPSLPFLSKLTLLQYLTLSDLRPLECLPELPVRLSRVRLENDGPMTYVVKEMELRFSELIRDKSSGLRKATKRPFLPIEFDIEEAFSSK